MARTSFIRWFLGVLRCESGSTSTVTTCTTRARGLCGRGTPGWRWLDLRALSTLLVSQPAGWRGATVSRVVYCTAVIDSASNFSGFTDQAIYLKALVATNSVDHIAYGTYVARVKYAPLAVRAASLAGGPQIVHPQWPIMVRDANGHPVPGATFMVRMPTERRRALTSMSHRTCSLTSSPALSTRCW
jgi:hypothetical protein